MMASMTGHRLTWGVPTETGGWKIVANSLSTLTKEELDHLVTLTDVGRTEEKGFDEGHGYFGEFRSNGASWAVFAHFYRSLEPVFTGQHFVQRDILLAPISTFRDANYDAQPFLDAVPPARVFSHVETKTEKWTALLDTPAEAHWLQLSSLDRQFLEQLLRAFLQPASTILVWQVPDRSLLASLLRLFPKVVREHLTFCTRVAEIAAAKVCIKCVPAFRADRDSPIVDLDKRLFRQPVFTLDTAFPGELLAAWRGDQLHELHTYVDDVVRWTSDQTKFVAALDAAAAQWLSKNEVRRAMRGGPEGWEAARKHIGIIATAPEQYRSADRRFVADELVRIFDPAKDGDRFSEFIRLLAPNDPELTQIEETSGERLAAMSPEAMAPLAKALASALPREAALQNLARETFSRLSKERMTLDVLPQLEAVFAGKKGPLPAEVIDRVLLEWTFGRMPKTAEVRSLMERVVSPERLTLLERNRVLFKELTDMPHGHIAVQLVATRFDRGDAKALFDLAREHPDAAAEVLSWSQAKPWIQSSHFAVLLIAQIADASRMRGRPTPHNDALVPLFVEHLEHSEDNGILSDERVVFAMGWAGRTDELRRRIEVVRLRVEGLAAEEELKQLLLKPPLAWKGGKHDAIFQLIATVAGKPRWAWYVASELHDDPDFPLGRFCIALREMNDPGAIVLLRSIAALVLLADGEPRADVVDVLSNALEGIVYNLPDHTQLRRHLAEKWSPSDHREYAYLLALLAAFSGRSVDSEPRRRALSTMLPESQLEAIRTRLSTLSVALRDVPRWPELERAERLADEPDVDLTVVENGIQNLILALEETALDRVLKERLARLRKKKKKEGRTWP
jgi:hypothetical protein